MTGRLSPEPIVPFRTFPAPLRKFEEDIAQKYRPYRRRFLVVHRACPDTLGVVIETEQGKFWALHRQASLGVFPTLYHACEACWAADLRSIYEA